MAARQLLLDLGESQCKCDYGSYIWSWETERFEKLDCIICGAKHDRPRPESLLQKRVLRLRREAREVS